MYIYIHHIYHKSNEFSRNTAAIASGQAPPRVNSLPRIEVAGDKEIGAATFDINNLY